MILIQKNKLPLFSIIITSFNRRNHIERAVDSLLAQTEKDFECIIVDDGSTDGTDEYAINLCKVDARFRYIFQSNQGQASAKNNGILASTGLYVTFLDSDDEYKPDHLEIRKEIINSYPDLDLLYGGVEIRGSKKVPDKENPKLMINIEDCIIGGTFVIKRASAIEVGCFDLIEYAEDSNFYTKMKNNKMLIAEIEYKTYIYNRENLNSITSEYNER